MNVCCIIPTFFRKKGLERAVQSLRNTAPDVIPVIVAEVDDINSYDIAVKYKCRHVVCKQSRAGSTYAWNEGLKFSKYHDAYFLGADDLEFTPNWLEYCSVSLYYELAGSGLVGVNDRKKDSEMIKAGKVQPTHYLMTRNFIINHNGGVMCIPHYRADYIDIETCLRAREAKQFAYAENAVVIHHWREQDDKAYQAADRYRKESKQIFIKRRDANFPNDFEPILSNGGTNVPSWSEPIETSKST